MSAERQALVEVLHASDRPLTPKHLAAATGKNYTTTKMLLAKMLAATVVIQPTDGHYALSPTYLSSHQPEKERKKEESAVDPVDPIDCVDPVDPVDSHGKRFEKEEVSGHGEVDGVCLGAAAAPEPVSGESTVENVTQPIVKIGQNGGTVYASTESTESTESMPLIRNGAAAPLDCFSPALCPSGDQGGVHGRWQYPHPLSDLSLPAGPSPRKEDIADATRDPIPRRLVLSHHHL